jgi:hypothetical protein
MVDPVDPSTADADDLAVADADVERTAVGAEYAS